MKKEIKTIANCTDEEFLKQSVKIRYAVEEWLNVTGILDIRKRMPQLEKITSNMTEEEEQTVKERNEKITREQIRKNFNDILDEALEKHPKETLKVIRLCCFVEPDDNSRKVTYYLGAFAQILNDKDVMDFFTSLVSMGQTLGLEL
jgi:hypothetical protein